MTRNQRIRLVACGENCGRDNWNNESTIFKKRLQLNWRITKPKLELNATELEPRNFRNAKQDYKNASLSKQEVHVEGILLCEQNKERM